MLPKKVKVTRCSIVEYAQALRNRYFGVSKEGKDKMLDEFTQVTSLHHKAAIWLLKQINSNLEQLWQLAERPASLGNRNYEATRRLQ